MDIMSIMHSRMNTVTTKTVVSPVKEQDTTVVEQTTYRSAYHEAAAKYDVTNMSAPELREMSQMLYDSGEIGLHELGMIQISSHFPMEKHVDSNGNVNLISPYKDDYTKKWDYLQQAKDSVEFMRSRGDKKSLENAEKILTIFEKLNTLRNTIQIESYV